MKKPINYAELEKYIFECIDFSEYQENPTEKRKKLIYLLEVCKKEKRYNAYKTEKYMFIEWCYGLPSCFNMDYQQYKVIELMKAFNIPIPKNEYELYDRWYGQLYDSIKYLISKK